MAEVDADLGARLSRLAAAVPVSASRLDSVHRDAVRARRQLRMAWLTPLVVLLVGATVVELLGVNPFAAGGRSESTRIGDFELTISSAKAHYDVGEPIQISAALAYVGPNASAEIAHPRGDAIGFGLVEPVLADLVLGPALDLGGRRPRVTLTAGKPLTAPFRKSGGWGANEPRAQEKRAFLDDPVLRLPRGTWHPYAQVVLWDTSDLEVAITLTVDVEIVVGDVSPNGPVVDRDADGPFSIVLRSSRGTWLESEPIDVTAVMTYSGTTPAAVTAFIPLAFSIVEPVLGMEVRSRPRTDAVCPPSDPVQPGERFASPFQKAGHVADDDPAYGAKSAWLNDPELRLPPGTWHLRVGGSLLSGSCSSAISVEAEIEIVVLADPATAGPSQSTSLAPTTAPSATEPAIRPSPPPPADGSPIAIDRDDSFELHLKAGDRVFRAGDPIDLQTSYSYIGLPLNATVAHFAPELAFSIEQLDVQGQVIRSKIYDSACVEQSMRSGIDRPAGISDDDLMSIRAASLPGNFDDELNEGILVLGPGQWRIGVGLHTMLGGCQGEDHGLSVWIDITVVPSSWARVNILTASRPVDVCPLARHEGFLAPNTESGIGTANGSGVSTSVRWPYGWSGWRDGNGIVLLDERGSAVAREGDHVAMGGGIAADVDFYACSGIEVQGARTGG